jgi:hypothetical protein
MSDKGPAILGVDIGVTGALALLSSASVLACVMPTLFDGPPAEDRSTRRSLPIFCAGRPPGGWR